MRRPGLAPLLTIIRKTNRQVKIFVINVMRLVNAEGRKEPLRTAPVAKMVDFQEKLDTYCCSVSADRRRDVLLG